MRALAAGITFSPTRKRWSVKYHLGAAPFRLRSRNAESAVRQRKPMLDAIIQYGATFSARAAGVPYFLYCDSNVHISRDDPHAWAAQLGPAEVDAAVAREQTVYDGAAGIFTFSDRVRASFVGDLRIPGDRVETVYAGPNFDPALIPPMSAQGARAPNILFVGREFQRKGGDVLLAAFAEVRREIPDATLTIIGPRDLTLSIPGVEVLGFLRKDDPAEYTQLLDAYARARAFAFRPASSRSAWSCSRRCFSVYRVSPPMSGRFPRSFVTGKQASSASRTTQTGSHGVSYTCFAIPTRIHHGSRRTRTRGDAFYVGCRHGEDDRANRASHRPQSAPNRRRW